MWEDICLDQRNVRKTRPEHKILNGSHVRAKFRAVCRWAHALHRLEDAAAAASTCQNQSLPAFVLCQDTTMPSQTFLSQKYLARPLRSGKSSRQRHDVGSNQQNSNQQNSNPPHPTKQKNKNKKK